MRGIGLFITAVFVMFSTILYGCGTQSLPSTATIPPARDTPTSTLTPSPPAAPTVTNTLEPTSIPSGIQVYPVDSLGKGIPWLPSDEDNKPMAVYYAFNLRKPPFNYVLVRQAFAAAIDREQIAQKALEYNFRNALPATSLTPPEILSRDLYNEVGIPFDPARAKQLLQEAGYSATKSFPPTTLLVSVRGIGAPGAYYQMAKIIVEMWETNLGVKVEIETANVGDYRNRFDTRPPDIYQLGWGADYNDPDNFLKALFHSGSEFNYGRFNHPKFDELVEEAALLTDPEKRLLLYVEAERVLTEEKAGVIPLYHSYVPIPYVH